jgi:hypothetical protein
MTPVRVFTLEKQKDFFCLVGRHDVGEDLVGGVSLQGRLVDSALQNL